MPFRSIWTEGHLPIAAVRRMVLSRGRVNHIYMYLIHFMQRTALKLFCFCFWLAGWAAAQAPLLVMLDAADGVPPSLSSLESARDGVVVAGSAATPAGDRASVPLVVPAVLPRMAPELALQVCRGRAVIQADQL